MSNLNSLIHDEVIEVWKTFCELHYELYNCTCDEYQLLLESKIEELEEQVTEKVKLISSIKKLEKRRASIIDQLNNERSENKIENVSGLIQYMQSNDVNESYRTYLNKYNALLIDIITKIQAQNIKNQVFINKSIHNLRSIREGLSGQKKVSTYNSSGKELRQTSLE